MISPNSPDATPASEQMRWSVAQRLAFIELRLFWDGSINRSDLVEQFAISIPQASADLARYQDLAPENLRYDPSSKAYHATTNFTPRLAKPDARSYLTQLLMLADQGISQDASWIGFAPAHAVVPRVRRRLDAKTLRPIVNAIHQKRGVFISYQSMNNPALTSRWIDPHALVFDGARWHVRAWCHKRSHFADFVLARVLDIIDTRPAEAPNSSLDREWHEHVDVRLAPNPSLTDAQKRAVEYDYGMVDGEISIRMRLCLTYYFEKHLGLDLDPATLPQGRIQVVWVNRSDVQDQRAQSPNDRAES
jgi:hypothetical protein